MDACKRFVCVCAVACRYRAFQCFQRVLPNIYTTDLETKIKEGLWPQWPIPANVGGGGGGILFIASEMLWIFRRLLKIGLPASIQQFNCHFLNFKCHTLIFRGRTWRKGQMPLFTAIAHGIGKLKMRSTLLSIPEKEHHLRTKWIPCPLKALPSPFPFGSLNNASIICSRHMHPSCWSQNSGVQSLSPSC